jgi:hypothetical protein
MAHITPGKTFLGIQVDDALLARIDDFLRRRDAQTPGSETSRSAAVRILITKGLDAVADAPSLAPKVTP